MKEWTAVYSCNQIKWNGWVHRSLLLLFPYFAVSRTPSGIFFHFYQAIVQDRTCICTHNCFSRIIIVVVRHSWRIPDEFHFWSGQKFINYGRINVIFHIFIFARLSYYLCKSSFIDYTISFKKYLKMVKNSFNGIISPTQVCDIFHIANVNKGWVIH